MLERANSTLPAIPPDIAFITGPTLVGIMLNWGFMGVLGVQIYFYHLNFPDDRKVIKFLVYGLFILDILQTCLFSADAFHWFVYGFGNMVQLDEPFLNSWDVPLLDAVISLIVQTFYCWRIYIIRGKSYVIPMIIVLISITQCIGGIFVAVRAYKLGHMSLISSEVAEEVIWLVGSALADILITITLAWTLMRSRRKELPASQQLLSKIVRLTVETNALTASVAFISIILYLGIPQHSTLVVSPTAVIGKLYTNCLVAVFNNRRLKADRSTPSYRNVNPSMLSGVRNNNHKSPTTSMGDASGTSSEAIRIQVFQEIDLGETDRDRRHGIELFKMEDQKGIVV